MIVNEGAPEWLSQPLVIKTNTFYITAGPVRQLVTRILVTYILPGPKMSVTKPEDKMCIRMSVSNKTWQIF